MHSTNILMCTYEMCVPQMSLRFMCRRASRAAYRTRFPRQDQQGPRSGGCEVPLAPIARQAAALCCRCHRPKCKELGARQTPDTSPRVILYRMFGTSETRDRLQNGPRLGSSAQSEPECAGRVPKR